MTTQLSQAELEDLRQKALEHMFIQLAPPDALKQPGGLLTFVKGKGIRLTDATGKEWLDAAAGWQLVGIGHGRKEMADAMYAQALEIAYVPPVFTSIPSIQLATKLAESTPGSLSRVFFTSSGSEAVETALHMAKQYHYNQGEGKRFKVIARRGSYHGTTWGAMSVNGLKALNLHYFEPHVPGSIFVAHPNCYRCEYGLTYPACDLLCAKAIETVIQFENASVVAAVIAEVVSHSAGVVPPPPEYWPMVRSICDRYGVLLIADEVITGFGRTGKMFACEHYNLIPDIMCVAKSITSGYVPLSATIAKKEIGDVFQGDSTRMFAHIATWGGHPVACAAALKNLEIIHAEKLVENSAAMGKYLLDGLETLRKHRIVGDVRGIGLLVAVELVKNKETKEQFKPEDGVGAKLAATLDNAGLLHRGFETILLTPPLTINRQEVEEIVAILDRSMAELSKEAPA